MTCEMRDDLINLVQDATNNSSENCWNVSKNYSSFLFEEKFQNHGYALGFCL